MKKFLSLALAGTAILALSQPTYAEPKEGKRGKAHAKAQAPGQMKKQAVVQQRPQVAKQRSSAQLQARAGQNVRAHNQRAQNFQRQQLQRAQTTQRAQTAQRVQNQRARSFQQSQSIQRAQAQRTQNFQRVQAARRSQIVQNAQREQIQRNRQVNRNQPSVAFGGQRRSVTTNNFAATRTWDRDNDRWRDRDGDRGRRWNDGDWRDGRRYFYRPPIATYRNWDYNRVYTWNSHRWRWYNNNWIIVDASPDYHYYDYDLPVATSYTYSSGSLVADVQTQLAREGYDPGPIDGVMGLQTRSALAEFQRDSGLASTGRVDSDTLRELNLN